MDINQPISSTHPPVIEHKVIASSPEEMMVRTKLLLRLKDDGFKVHKIQENVFSAGKNDTWAFFDRNGEIITAVSQIRGDESKESLKEESKKLFQAVSWQAGYREIDDPKTNSYILYNIQSGEDKVVLKDTKEYFQAWKDIEFHYERGQVLIMGKDPLENEAERLKVLKTIGSIAKDGNLRIKDLLFLASPKRGYLKQVDFMSLLPIVRGYLLSQIGDPRWDRTLDPSGKHGGYPVLKEEFDQYLSLHLIDQPLYNQAVKKLAEVEKLKQQKTEKSQGVMDSTRGKVGEIKK